MSFGMFLPLTQTVMGRVLQNLPETDKGTCTLVFQKFFKN